MTERLAIIGGTGAAQLFPGGEAVDMPAGKWGAPSSTVQRHVIGEREVLFMARHGPPHASGIAPHLVNYRANIWALRELGAEQIIGLNAVGGIAQSARPGRVVIPNQLIDYTWGREHSYAALDERSVQHVDFTMPFDAPLRGRLVQTADALALEALTPAIYGVTQGPRLETAAEINRLERDGCDVVGMTLMPEAGLARELAVAYASCCVVVNWAAGRGAAHVDIYAQIAASLAVGMERVKRLITGILAGD